MMKDVARALNEQRGRLYGMRTPAPVLNKEGALQTVPLFKGGEAERILRIEIERGDREADLYRYLHETGQLRGPFYDHEGPHTFQRVDVYFVDRLPAPGWRIVNPFAR